MDDIRFQDGKPAGDDAARPVRRVAEVARAVQLDPQLEVRRPRRTEDGDAGRVGSPAVQALEHPQEDRPDGSGGPAAATVQVPDDAAHWRVV